MRGRKHPLEVFRENGRTFQTRRDAASRESPESPESIGSEPDEPPRRSLRPRPPRPATREPASPRAAPAPIVAEEKPPARRTWDARPKLQRAGPGLRGATALSLPLPRVMVVLAGLVLVVGAAYALRLWPFASEGASGQDPVSLQSPLRWLWPDRRAETGTEGAAADGAGDGARPEDDRSGSEQTQTGREVENGSASRPVPAIEYWVLVASVKLTAEEAKSGARNDRFKPDQEKIQKALAKQFPWMRTEICFGSAKREDMLLRVGPAAAADDAELLKLRDKIQALDPHFKDAYIKPYRTKR